MRISAQCAKGDVITAYNLINHFDNVKDNFFETDTDQLKDKNKKLYGTSQKRRGTLLQQCGCYQEQGKSWMLRTFFINIRNTLAQLRVCVAHWVTINL